MQIGDFKYTIDKARKEADIVLGGDSFYSRPGDGGHAVFYLSLNADTIYQLEYIINDAKRKLELS